MVSMMDVLMSSTFEAWFLGLRDRQAQKRIQVRIDRMAGGNFGDVKPVGEGISEARIHYAAGYRLYFMQRGAKLLILLAGGDKDTQDADIARAYAVAQHWKE